MKVNIRSSLCTLFLLAITGTALADKNIQSIAEGVQTQLTAISSLIIVAAYVAGVGFSLMGIVQFKAHKDNPQQVPLSKPIVYLIIAACLLFLPSIMSSAGETVFGSDKLSSKKGDK